MIRFIRLLFFHIYIYYYKVDKGNKALAKFTTFLIFTIIIVIFITSLYDLIFQYSNIYYTTLSGINYIYIYIIFGSLIAYYLYKEKFNGINKFKDYHTKYYFYFFIIILLTLIVGIITGKTSRKRIFEQRAIYNVHGSLYSPINVKMKTYINKNY